MGPMLTIRLKLLFLVVLACLPALGLALYSGLAAERQALREAEAEAARISRDISLQEQHLMAGARQFLATLARLPAVRDLDAKACGPLFRELLAANPFYNDVILTSLTGDVLASAQDVPSGLNLSDSSYFSEVLKNEGFAVGGFRKSRTTGVNVLVCGHPVLGPQRQIIGVVSTGLRLDIFDDIVREVSLPEGSTIFLADRQGLRLFNRHFPDPRPGFYPQGGPVKPEVWKHIQQKPKGVPFADIGMDGQRRIFMVQESRLTPQAQPYLYVSVSLPEATVLKQARKSLYSALSLLSLATVLAAATAWLTGKKLFVERIERLAQVAGRFAAGDLAARANLPSSKISSRPDELDQLGQAVDSIGEKLSQREAERKRQEAALRSLLDETAAVTGQAFFNALAVQLVSVLDVFAAFAAEYLNNPPDTVHPLVLTLDQGEASSNDFPLAHSPGKDIPRDGYLLISTGVRECYPENPFLHGSKAEGYLGVPMLDAAGTVIGHLAILSARPMEADPALIAILRLFAQRAAAELLRLRSERAMLASLREKEVLLKEIHHRVKNNMQIISSLLTLQARDVSDPALLELVAQSRARILSMALVHEDLYQSDNLAQIDFHHYLTRLVERTRSGIAANSRVRFELEMDRLPLTVDQAIPLGLLCNELFTNALKHAFPDNAEGLVLVRLTQGDGQAVLTVRDNGQGLPPGYVPGQGNTLGLQLVWSLADQLHGEVEAHNDGGAVFTISFPIN